MGYNVFFISDTHFGHESPYTKFLREDGSFLRHHGSAEAGDEAMVENWNKVVKSNDRVYHVGDVSMTKKHLPILSRLNGRKVLIKGNHDIEKLNVYTPYFDDIRGSHQFDGMFICHVPIHPDSLGRWGFNIHGHLHHRRVMRTVIETDMNAFMQPRDFEVQIVDPRYFNVSVECINYTPISLEEVRKHKPELEQ